MANSFVRRTGTTPDGREFADPYKKRLNCTYEPGGEAEAEGFQADMQNLLVDYSGTQEIRMLWGTFGDTDITDAGVRKLYYDDATWKGLQQLKQQVDKGDLFHTRFTVQLP